MRAIQKCIFYWIWVTMSKVMGIYVKFWHFLQCPLSKYGHVTWPKKQISKKNLFFLILHLILGKAAKFVVEKLSTSEVISQKPHGGGKHPPPVLLGLRGELTYWRHLFLIAHYSVQMSSFYLKICQEVDTPYQISATKNFFEVPLVFVVTGVNTNKFTTVLTTLTWTIFRWRNIFNPFGSFSSVNNSPLSK